MEEQNKILEQVDKVLQALSLEQSYQKLQIIQKELQANQKAMKQIENVKSCQKAFVKSGGKSIEAKNAFVRATKELEDVPLYQSYLEMVEIVDNRFRFVENEINQVIEEIVNGSVIGKRNEM